MSPLSSLCLLKPPAEMRRSAFSTSMPASDSSRRVAAGFLEVGDDLTVTLSSPAVTWERQEAILDLRCLAGGEELWTEGEASCVFMVPQVVVMTLLLSVLHSTPITATVPTHAGITVTTKDSIYVRLFLPCPPYIARTPLQHKGRYHTHTHTHHSHHLD